MLDSFFKWLARRPVSCILAILFALVYWAQYLPDLKLDTSANGLIIHQSEEARYYEGVKEIFGDDTALVVVYKADDIFTEPVLQSIEDFSLEAEQIEGVSRVISLATASNLKGGEGYLDTELLMPYVPEDPEEIERIRTDALSNQLNIGEVINAAGTVSAIQLSIESRPEDATFDTELVTNVDALIQAQKEILGPSPNIA